MGKSKKLRGDVTTKHKYPFGISSAMGTFMGHVVPGTFFFGFGTWWLYNVFYRYFYAKRFRPTTYKNSSCFHSRLGGQIPTESILKIVAVVIGITGEFVTGFRNGRFVQWGNAQHITMFFFFGLNGVADICIAKKWDVPPKLDYVTAALAFGVEGFLFYHHLHDRSHMDVMVHMFLFYVITGCVLSTLLEMANPTNVMAAICRTYFTMLQGTWFYQVGFILYPPIGQTWDQDNHTQMMIVTLIFTWHVAILAITMSVIGVTIWFRVQNLPGPKPVYQMVDTSENLDKDDHRHRPYEHKLANGQLLLTNSDSILPILDSESEDA